MRPPTCSRSEDAFASAWRTAKRSHLTFQLSPDNLDTDPLFTTARNPALAPTTSVGDARLQSSSPVIDGGDDATCPTIDLDGVARPQYTTCDPGAYEFDGAVTPNAYAGASVAPADPLPGDTVIYTIEFGNSALVTATNVGLTLTHVSINGNRAISESGSIYNERDLLVLRNSIVWDNAGVSGRGTLPASLHHVTGTAWIEASVVQGAGE